MVGVHGDRSKNPPGRALSMILQPILHTSTEEACEDRLTARSVIDLKLQLKHVPVAIQSDIDKITGDV